jgi:transposase
MRRYELTDEQWARIEPLLPHRTHHGKAGHPFKDHRPIVNGILWVLHTGAPWRDLPERYGPWETVFYRFNRWRQDGTWSRIVTSLLDELDQRGQIDHDLWCIDGSVIRASRAAAGASKTARPARRLGGRQETQLLEPQDHALGRSRGGFGTKIHLACDSRGTIVAIHVTAGQRHESKSFEPTMARRLFRRKKGTRRWPRRLAGDKGYSYPRIRRWCQRRRVEAVIPTRKDQPRDDNFDKDTYKRRNIVERVVGWFKEYRRLGTRYEKLAVNYVAFWLVAIIDKALARLLPNTA